METKGKSNRKPRGKPRWGSLAALFDYRIYLEADLEALQNRSAGSHSLFFEGYWYSELKNQLLKEKVPKLTPAVVTQKDIMTGGFFLYFYMLGR